MDKYEGESRWNEDVASPARQHNKNTVPVSTNLFESLGAQNNAIDELHAVLGVLESRLQGLTRPSAPTATGSKDPTEPVTSQAVKLVESHTRGVRSAINRLHVLLQDLEV